MKQSQITNKNGVINSRKLMQAVGIATKEQRTKPVSTPLERTTTQLPDREVLANKIKTFNTLADQMRKYSKMCYYVYQIMLSSGCRVSEVLEVRGVDIFANGMVKIKGKKKGEDRIIHPGKALDYILDCRKNGVAPFMDINRKHVWSVFKKFGIEMEVGSSGKKVVTHALRHIMVASAKDVNTDNNTTGRFIGHKNKENTKRYGNIKK